MYPRLKPQMQVCIQRAGDPCDLQFTLNIIFHHVLRRNTSRGIHCVDYARSKRIVITIRCSLTFINDPFAGSPTKTLLRLLIPTERNVHLVLHARSTLHQVYVPFQLV